jgi:Tol biopolymer transport system component
MLYGPQWSPDGKTILYYDDEYFCGSKCDELHLTLMRPDGTNQRRLPAIFESTGWSPDGNVLLGQTGDGYGTLLTYNLRTKRRNFIGRGDAWSWQPLPPKRRP